MGCCHAAAQQRHRRGPPFTGLFASCCLDAFCCLARLPAHSAAGVCLCVCVDPFLRPTVLMHCRARACTFHRTALPQLQALFHFHYRGPVQLDRARRLGAVTGQLSDTTGAYKDWLTARQHHPFAQTTVVLLSPLTLSMRHDAYVMPYFISTCEWC